MVPSLNRVIGRGLWAMVVAAVLVEAAHAQDGDARAATDRWAIALHGGAGSRPRDMPQQEREALEASLREALAAGRKVLSAGGSALDAVEAVVVLMEDDPLFNAGKGAVFTRAGTHELDASIMEGGALRGGAVGGVTSVKNPVKAARLVMEHSPHVLMTSAGADAFAAANGCAVVTQDYFYTDAAWRELQGALAERGLEPLAKPAYSIEAPPAATEGGGEPGTSGGTVGCVALDVHGHLAAATSTGGLSGKAPGRLGDTPVLGAGTYANDANCAVSCTGKGEEFIRHSIAARVAWLMGDRIMGERRLGVDEAVRRCLEAVLPPGSGGIIALDRTGQVSLRATTGAMPRGVADSSGRFDVAIWFEP